MFYSSDEMLYYFYNYKQCEQLLEYSICNLTYETQKTELSVTQNKNSLKNENVNMQLANLSRVPLNLFSPNSHVVIICYFLKTYV